MKLTDHFTLDEFTASQTADRRSIDNTPPQGVLTNLFITAHGLEMIRALLQSPILITSGYRCPSLNAAIGSKPTSQHVKGQAVDFIAPSYGPPGKIMRTIYAHRDAIKYDQLILEFASQQAGRGWVHISFVKEAPRQQALIIDSTGTTTYA